MRKRSAGLLATRTRLLTAVLLAQLASMAAIAADGSSPKARWGPDAAGQQELARPQDPTFESVAQHYPMMTRPREALGVPESPAEFVVLPQGEIQLNNYGVPEHYCYTGPENQATAYFLFGKKVPKTRYGHQLAPDAKQLVDGYLPMVVVPFTHQEIEYRQTLFAWSEKLAADARLWAYVGLVAKNGTNRPRVVDLAYQVVCGKPANVVPVTNWSFELAPGEQRRFCLRVPRDGIRPNESITKDSPEFADKGKRSRWARLPYCGGFAGIELIEPAQFDRCFQESAAVWHNLIDRAVQIRTPEQRVNDAYRAWLGFTFLNVDKVGQRYEAHDGAGFYEDVFGVIAAKYCRALDGYGYPDKAGLYLDSMVGMVRPDGEFKTGFGLADAGSLLVALQEHHQFTRDQAWLARTAPVIVKMCDWITKRRAREKTTQAPTSANYGLIKYRPSADYPEPDYNYITDASLCVGLEAAGRALREVGETSAAKRAEKEAASYRRDICQSMDRAVFEHEGDRLLPILPASRGWLVKADYAAFCYYSLFGPILLDTEFLTADDWRADLVARTLETRGGLTAGVAAFTGRPNGFPAPLIDHAFTYGYWLHALKRDEPKKAILGLYGSMAYGMTRTTYGGVEMTHVFTGANAHTIPHLRSGTQQLRLLRAMLVREQGDQLILAQAVPQHWLADGKQVSVRGAPTHFGKVSYTIRSQVKEGRISVMLDPPKRTPPQAIVVHLRHPSGARIQSVLVDGKPIETFGGNTITLPRRERELEIEVDYHRENARADE